jgi:TolB-like protein/Flp pilus assembly protein TadD
LVATILRELQRRNVIRAAILYVTGVWALAQGIAALGPVVGAPEWVARWFLIAAAIGFPFWIAFAWFYEFTPDGIRRESEVDSDKAVLRATGRRLDFLIIGVLAVAVVLLLTDRFVRRDRAVTSLPPPVITEKSVAVLPLVNESGDANALYFSDGLSEAFIDALSQFPGLKVIARASSFQFRNSKDPVSVIGEKLGVAHLLEGSVQRAGDAVRISAELISIDDGVAIWSAHYDRPYRDLFKLQDDITSAVAASLKAKLLGGGNAPPPQSDRPPSGNLEAYNLYLEGMFYLHHVTQENMRKAAAVFSKAIKLDPDYAAAWAKLSAAELNGAAALGHSTVEILPQAREHAEKAVALAPGLALTHLALGSVLQNQLNWHGAEAEYRRAAQLAPALGDVKKFLASSAATLGRLEEAVALVRQGLKLNPLGTYYYVDLAVDLISLGRLREAEAAIRSAIALYPDGPFLFYTLSQIDILRGDAKTALADAQREPGGLNHDAAVAEALQIGTDRTAADAALRDFVKNYGGIVPLQTAEIYAVHKDADDTFEWLERARAAKDSVLQILLFDPFFLAYRHDPRFAKLCEELNLPMPKN